MALLGTTGGEKELMRTDSPHKDVSDRVQCVVDFFGPTDLTRMAAQALAEPAAQEQDRPRWAELTGVEAGRRADPAEQGEGREGRTRSHYVDKDDAPFLMLHGDADPLVPLGQSEICFTTRSKKAGVAAELVVIKGGGHGGAGFASKENQREDRRRSSRPI